MRKETHNKILRCPICEKGRIADTPANAELSHYHLFAMEQSEQPDLISKCPKCGAQIGIIVPH